MISVLLGLLFWLWGFGGDPICPVCFNWFSFDWRIDCWNSHPLTWGKARRPAELRLVGNWRIDCWLNGFAWNWIWFELFFLAFLLGLSSWNLSIFKKPASLSCFSSIWVCLLVGWTNYVVFKGRFSLWFWFCLFLAELDFDFNGGLYGSYLAVGMFDSLLWIYSVWTIILCMLSSALVNVRISGGIMFFTWHHTCVVAWIIYHSGSICSAWGRKSDAKFWKQELTYMTTNGMVVIYLSPPNE